MLIQLGRSQARPRVWLYVMSRSDSPLAIVPCLVATLHVIAQRDKSPLYVPSYYSHPCRLYPPYPYICAVHTPHSAAVCCVLLLSGIGCKGYIPRDTTRVVVLCSPWVRPVFTLCIGKREAPSCIGSLTLTNSSTVTRYTHILGCVHLYMHTV